MVSVYKLGNFKLYPLYRVWSINSNSLDAKFALWTSILDSYLQV